MSLRRLPLACLLLGIASAVVPAAEPGVESPPDASPAQSELPAVITPRDWLVLPRVGDYHRAALHVDPIEARVARGEWSAPKAGDKVLTAARDEVAWRADSAPRTGDLAGGYAYAEFDSPSAGVLLLESAGAAAGGRNQPVPYGSPGSQSPLRQTAAAVIEGKNWLLVHLADPKSAPSLARPTAPVSLLAARATLPDLLLTDKGSLVGSIPLVNASDEPLAGALLSVGWDGAEPTTQRLRTIDSRLVSPITFKLPAAPEGLTAGATLTLRVSVLPANASAQPITSVELAVRVVGPNARRTETFLSGIDGSVQPYAVIPAAAGGGGPAGLLVALHDAGESAEACLRSYQPLAGVHVMAPMGRGRWAFDWEDWSRIDALEAIDQFQQRQRERGAPLDAERVALVGRGLGGHGALSLATLAPERFSAVGAADGWISFYTQGGALAAPADAGPIEELLARQAAANDPLQTLGNLSGMGVNILHTGRDRAPAEESRYLRERLGEFHNDFSYREPTEGVAPESLLTDQVEWLLSRRRHESRDLDEVQFATPDVGVLSQRGWAAIQAPDRQGDVARISLHRDLVRQEVIGATDNVRRMRIDFDGWPTGADQPAWRVRLDGAEAIDFTPGREGEALALARDSDGEWRRVPDLGNGSMRQFASLLKNPERPGGFKSAFCCRPLLVYGTKGSPEEQRWAAAKARYDAHLFLYRGAGRLEVAADTALPVAPASQKSGPIDQDLRDPTRSIILYGNRATNSAWPELQREAFQRRSRFLRVEADRAWIGRRPESGDNLAVIGLRPRVGGRRASVAIVGGTGPVGMRMTTRLRYFWSGIAYPDFLLFGPASLGGESELGAADDSAPLDDVRAAGYFDSDWGIDSGGVIWRDLAI